MLQRAFILNYKADYYRSMNTDQRWIAISSRGERYSIDLKKYI